MEDKEVKKEKFTYDELNNIATQLSKQNEQLYNQLQQANYTNTFARLEFLFKVTDHPDVFSKEFYNNCVAEIEQLMTIPKVEENIKSNE